MPRVKDSKYIYAVSRIKVIANRLLGRAGIDRMIDAATAQEALKVLSDARYGNGKAESLCACSFEKLLAEEHKKLYGLLRELAPDQEAFALFLQPQDFHMVKVILKAEFAGIEDFDALLTGRGSIDAQRLKTMVRERNFGAMHAVMSQAIKAALDDFHHTGDLKTVDLIMDRACFQSMREIADSFNSSFLSDYVACRADLLNMDFFLRLKPVEYDMEFLQRVLVPGGSIPLEAFLGNRDSVRRRLADELGRTPWGASAKRSADAFSRGGGLNWLEEAYHDMVHGFIKRAGSKIFGLEPLVSYLLLKEKEIGIVRRVMTWKLGGMPGDRIRERLGRLYA